MPLRINCPACKAVCNVPDEVQGRKVRCPKCKELFVVPAAQEKKDRPDDDRESEAKGKKSRTQEAAIQESRKVKAAAPQHEQDDDWDDDDRPRVRSKRKEPAKGGSGLILILAGVAFVLLLCVISAGAIGTFFMLRKAPVEDKIVQVENKRNEDHDVEKKDNPDKKDKNNPDKKDKNNPEKKLPETLQTNAYQNGIHGFSIHFPKNYSSVAKLGKGTIVMYQHESGLANINLRSAPAGNETAANIFADIKRALPTQLKNAKVHGDGETTIDSVPAFWLDMSHNADGKNIRQVAYVLVKDRKFYTIFCTAGEEVFEFHRAAFRDSAESLKVK